jgi:large subunit ribosomal protein L17
MRHKVPYRQLGRSVKHRKALFRNLATALIKHERIVTTLAKAKEMRPLIERLVHKAKRGSPNDQIFMKSVIMEGQVINHLKYKVAPRFKKQLGGFTRVTNLGRRKVDSAEMARIELIKNRYEKEEKNELEITLEMNDMLTFWQWENKLLEQEIDYYEDHLRRHKAKMDDEINGQLVS